MLEVPDALRHLQFQTRKDPLFRLDHTDGPTAREQNGVKYKRFRFRVEIEAGFDLKSKTSIGRTRGLDRHRYIKETRFEQSNSILDCFPKSNHFVGVG